MTPFGIQITLDYRSKKSKNCSTLLAREQKTDFRGGEGKGGRGRGRGGLEHLSEEVVLSICATIWHQNHFWLSAKKVETIVDIISAY